MEKKRRPPRSTAESHELLKSIIHFMRQKQQLSLQELISIYAEVIPEEAVPVSIFSHDLSPSESLCRFLKENRNLTFHDIAALLNRDDRSIWTSYTRAAKKSRQQFTTSDDDLMIPLSIFQDRSMSILEHVVDHLKTEHKLSNSGIARLISKNPSSIATVANRASAKRGAGR
ncbi:hypothetical protein JW898_04280 [Candidatus Woesearchaeota archaeon]|nr:hypothetical protein [Candidatus Woesearchaeota archaeon]